MPILFITQNHSCFQKLQSKDIFKMQCKNQRLNLEN